MRTSASVAIGAGVFTARRGNGPRGVRVVGTGVLTGVIGGVTVGSGGGAVGAGFDGIFAGGVATTGESIAGAGCGVGAHFAGALAAIDIGDCGPDHERRFDYVLTYDRDLVVEIARSMLARIQSTPAQRY